LSDLSRFRLAGLSGGRGNGGQGQNRTADTVIFSHVLYQLSYLAIGESRIKPAPLLARQGETGAPTL
jgi:hypothetical protein